MWDEYPSGDRRWERPADNLEAPWRSKQCDHLVVSDEEFDRWYELNTRDDDRRSPSDEVALRAWFRSLFDRCGPVSRAESGVAHSIGGPICTGRGEVSCWVDSCVSFDPRASSKDHPGSGGEFMQASTISAEGHRSGQT